MSRSVERVHLGAAAAAGPLLFLERTRGVALNEWVIVRQPGAPDRRGQVIDAGEHATVIQLLDETVGLAPDRAVVTLTGDVATTVVGRELLGRAFDGHGAPIDGLPAPVGEDLRSINGAPINPVRRDRPRDFIETGISAIDAMNTLVRGQKLPVFSAAGLPSKEVVASILRNSRLADTSKRFVVVFAALGLNFHEYSYYLNVLEEMKTGFVAFVNMADEPVSSERLCDWAPQ